MAPKNANNDLPPIGFCIVLLLGSKYAQNLRQDASGLTLITARKIKPTSVKLVQIHEFQEMMKRLYFKRDSERGIDGTYNWLVDEVAELGEELKGNDKEATEKEFADVIAWLASLANIMGIDLEKATLTKYNDKCPKCQGSPCQCTF
jgi:NTP pyrophosphatase (non-canonical NTP hydrolase)